CDLVRLQVDDVCAGGRVRDRGTVIQKKTGRPVQFEIMEQTRASIHDWLSKVELRNGRYLFPSRLRAQGSALLDSRNPKNIPMGEISRMPPKKYIDDVWLIPPSDLWSHP